MEKKVTITTETITLGQLLKLVNLIETGGAAKWFLQEYNVFVNGEKEDRRGRKLKDGDRVEIERIGTFIVTQVE
ncbi:S4 domain-containing protein YaaA [Geobacillus thermodenitrificans]|jgi:ribosome-associated protein|uniref:S4 domain-containing protein YaaA n=1 Tax=Geobacillus thermodenitrificans TaxID=33940 RepID=UPI00017E5EF8|nr:S4 domain-containing protein YaaA [Geobacillus thermodenitrificans]MEC5188261.1 ribosome-associated protein [Geobacillus thermodenitrificans]MED0663478.1 S4 domain-containing protein YaaA [Geobacillus thermodenitrificans]